MSNSSSPEPTTKDDEVTNSGSKRRPEPLRTLPNLVTDEEGTAIPEACDGSSMYQYRDFSNVPEEELEQQPTTPPPTSNSRGAVESSIRVQKFPVKLYAILAQKEFQDIITWMPHGRSWKVLKPNLFESLVMPLFFEYSNYHSFNRLVNAWSFRRISSGPDRGSYYHEV
jgi:HSF-type DNA-binding